MAQLQGKRCILLGLRASDRVKGLPVPTFVAGNQLFRDLDFEVRMVTLQHNGAAEAIYPAAGRTTCLQSLRRALACHVHRGRLASRSPRPSVQTDLRQDSNLNPNPDPTQL